MYKYKIKFEDSIGEMVDTGRLEKRCIKNLKIGPRFGKVQM